MGRILLIEFNEQNSFVFDKIMKTLKESSGFECLRLDDEPMVSLPGLEIYPGQRKIYRDRRYMKLSAQYETEQAEIGRLAKSLEQEIESEAGQVADVGRFLQLADWYSDLQELDAATVNELIEKIVIHSPEKNGGKKHVTIEVYFTYVGKIRIPLSKSEPLAATEKPA